ncbi:unnamed protein product [Linum trigynum]|uniref:Uncharacterized protein n=1 Tax=Linum trigynum TaxID=586398 RepID=A0AAV2DXR3_9ROSI
MFSSICVLRPILQLRSPAIPTAPRNGLRCRLSTVPHCYLDFSFVRRPFSPASRSLCFLYVVLRRVSSRVLPVVLCLGRQSRSPRRPSSRSVVGFGRLLRYRPDWVAWV